jgi:peroxiredoxin (alkyl hydroperoxide reductase subunit C)
MAAEDERTTSLPRIGETAPLFKAVTTMGEIRLEDFRGSWVVLFSHPGDFSPVCTTEFIALANAQSEFKKRGVELLGLSIDSLNSHIAWVRNIEERTGVKITFPIIADSDLFISTLYGMINPAISNNETSRCVFILDPKQVIRALIYYPANIGRNTDELLRLIDALQAADQYNISTPANWKPGDMVIVPPPNTQSGAESRLSEKFECIDWYLCKKKLE